ncbi:3-dehydroquinate synthase family protein, partial [Desulfotalea psychrophila]|uniref:Probable 3-dehydroquinate synthase n=1 Tax=Desulfotalea psychrophila (strain LSv54 / DSM 12343) TaxID=177439 RepID=Q6AN72_DESPS|nr:probable 3-dehydroquinate synthase [Desulfotalea psychrophila LSv54]
MAELTVGLGARSYPIRIERGCLDGVGDSLAELQVGNRYAIIVDDYVAGLYGDRLCASLTRAGIRFQLFSFPRGEENKNLTTFADLASRLARARFDRHDAIIALGGGVTGDLAGYLAASYMRGIPFVQVPTTLLSQVDSSVGGKTGVDIPEGKNLVGAFYQPKAVFIDPQVLETLAHEELLGGLAEVIKYGVIWD